MATYILRYTRGGGHSYVARPPAARIYITDGDGAVTRFIRVTALVARA